jgi:hypothetical protein
MRKREVKSTQPLPPPFLSMQEQMIEEVRQLFRAARCSDYIKHINYVLAYGVGAMAKEAGPEAAHDAAYYTTQVLTLIVRLQEITSEAREEMYQGGMSIDEVYKIT